MLGLPPIPKKAIQKFSLELHETPKGINKAETKSQKISKLYSKLMTRRQMNKISNGNLETALDFIFNDEEDISRPIGSKMTKLT